VGRDARAALIEDAFDFARDVRVDPDPRSLSAALADAARGRFPPADHAVLLVPAPVGAKAAVIAFSGHHVIASELEPELVVKRLREGGVVLPTDPRFLAWLTDAAGSPSSSDTIDVVLARPGLSDADALPFAAPSHGDLEDPRVAFAAASRTDLRLLRPEGVGAVVVLGRGLERRLEVSIELDPDERGTGLAARLLHAALAAAGPDELVFAQVSAGNAAALRAAMGARFALICAEYLIR
jgi:GNAT superfamily N-acetyltransferase